MSAVSARDVPSALDAYERFREADGADADLLGYVAALLLEQSALGDDGAARDAALAQLRMAGTEGRPALRRISEQRERPVARAKALAALAARGDDQAEALLYALLDEDDPALLAPAVDAIDPQTEAPRLVALLEHTAAEVRAAAAKRLPGAAPDGAAMLALSLVARVDPESRVRSAATAALGAFGDAVFDTVRGRLSDPESAVRLAAVRALVQANRMRALGALGSLLATPPSPAGIEAARFVALTGARHEPGVTPDGLTDARAYLRTALRTADSSLRSQAAIALVSLPEESSLDDALLVALGAEVDATAKLGIARALLGREAGDEAARAALHELLDAGGVPAIQAAGLLGEHDEAAIDLLLRMLEAESPFHRRVAGRVLARGAMRPDAARAALRDEDELVRIHTAGGILAAVAAG